MVSLTNGLFSGGDSGHRASGNGCYLSSPGGYWPKYKLRKVSAVRDFPPGCGRNASIIDRPSDESALALDENARTDESAFGEIKHLASPDLVTGGLTANGAANGMKNEGSNAGVIAQGCKSSGDTVKVAVMGNTKSPGMEGQVSVEVLPEEDGSGRVTSEGVEGRKFSDNDIAVGEENRKLLDNSVLLGEKNKNLLNRGIFNDSFPRHLPERPIVDSSAVEEEALRPRNKHGRRKVSATRDFPPFCGNNPSHPSKEDRLKISASKNSCSVSFVRESSEDLFATSTSVNHVSLQILENVNKGMTTMESVKGKSGKIIADANCDMIRPKETPCEPINSSVVIERESDNVLTVVGTLGEVKMTDGVVSRVVTESGDSEKVQSGEVVWKPSTSATIATENEEHKNFVATVGKELVYSQDSVLDRNLLDVAGLGEGRVIVQALMAAPFCPWRQGKVKPRSSAGNTSGRMTKKSESTGQRKLKLTTKRDGDEVDHSRRKARNKKTASAEKALHESYGAVKVVKDGPVLNSDKFYDFSACETPSSFDVSLPPFGPNSSSQGDARNRVRETLRLFQAIYRKLLQGQEATLKQGEEFKSQKQDKESKRRFDLVAAKFIKEKGKEVNTGNYIVGAVPGVEVGDEFQFRVELAIVGVHRLYQAGIDYVKHDGKIIAISIVASGVYADDMENADVLVYSGQGGNVTGKDKQPEDQKLERGNLALKNSISTRNPVRVIRGSKERASETFYAKGKMTTIYVYDGLYTVENCRTNTGQNGKLVFMFELRRIPGQPELAWKEVKMSKKYKVREGLCVDDISGGEESFPICAVNTIDDEKPAPFTYTTRMIYPDLYNPVPPNGCDCTGKCSNSRKCLCASKNGGERPYNCSGAIVEAKALVYECGPSCNCPPDCYNRVSQHGINVPLEIFKTETRGWGVRSLSSIPSGTFICEYTGELLEDKEAEQRVGSDEYLFDIGQNYNDFFPKPDSEKDLNVVIDEGGFTIDAAQYGNVGRFINHSCSPNLYAQNVLYDHEDKRMPHIMLFAAENIPPLQELTYHYNYSLDEVRDSNGNIKMKSCYCGSAECTGRMY